MTGNPSTSCVRWTGTFQTQFSGTSPFPANHLLSMDRFRLAQGLQSGRPTCNTGESQNDQRRTRPNTPRFTVSNEPVASALDLTGLNGLLARLQAAK